MMIKFNVASVHLCTELEGPFRRAAIWFQGCDIGCPGCCNPELQPLTASHIVTLEELVGAVADSRRYGTEGVTFLGGEPTLQQNLHILAQEIQRLGMGVILFTGRRIEELDLRLLGCCDLIADGAFIAEKRDNKRNLIGSENQELYFITDRYRASREWFYQKRSPAARIDVSDGLYITGDVL